MIDKEDNVALSFLDDGRAFKDNLFRSALMQRDIPVEEKY